MLLPRNAVEREKDRTDRCRRFSVDNIQYELIRKQFDCMADYLSWDMLFQKSYYATARDDLQKNMEALEELENIGSC